MPSVRVALAILAATGCGRLEFDRRDGAPDDAPPAADARPPLCLAWGPFSAPARLAGPINTLTDEWEPAPLPGGTVLYYEAYLGTLDLLVATRPDTTADFAAGNVITELSTANFDERSPTLTDDGLILLYASNNGPTFDLWAAERSTTADLFAAGGPVPVVNSDLYEASPWLSGDGLRLVFASERLGPSDLFETTRASRTADFATPQKLVELDSGPGDFELAPSLTSDGLEIFFASSRLGTEGGLDLYRARRPTVDAPFGAVEPVPEISTPFDDTGAYLPGDGTTIYVNVDTDIQGGRNADVWTATRSCLD